MLRKLFRFIFFFLIFLFIGSFLVFFKADRSPESLAFDYGYPDSQYFEWEGMQVHFRETGNGDPILLLHGTGSSLHTWEAWTEVLSKSYKVYSLDLPGYGLTGPDPSEIYNAARYGELLLAFAERQIKDTFHLAGNSLGGAIAWSFAAENPDWIKKLILVDPAGIEGKKDYTPLAIRLAKNKLLSPLVRWITPRFLVEESLLDAYGEDRRLTHALVDRYFNLQLREGNRRAFIDRLNQNFWADGRPSLTSVASPTLILWGEADTWISPDHAPLFRDSIPNSRLILYPDAGHVPMEEIPEETGKDVLLYLEG
ncbi:MAG: alpha/beta hydrolase [Bacteroidetes bacterium]|nr:alpha/beta hydrolase [Bacteroidota bacterium]